MFHLAARARVHAGDVLQVVGDGDALGNWDPRRALSMTTTAASYPLWTVELPMPDRKVEFRLLVKQARSLGRVCARSARGWEFRWEAPVRQPARTLDPAALPRAPIEFGVEVDSDGVRSCSEDHVLLAAGPDAPHQLRLAPGLCGGAAVELSSSAAAAAAAAPPRLDLLGPLPHAQVSLFDPAVSDGRRCETVPFALASQPAGDLAFNVRREDALFVVRLCAEAGDAVLGAALLSPGLMHGERGRASVPLVSREGAVVGTAHWGYTWVAPLACAGNNLRRLWSLSPFFASTRLIDIAHRGLGSSLNVVRPSSSIRVTENTVLSFNQAAQFASFVEFDVQVTKCGTPVIFHDFLVLVNTAPRMFKPVCALDLAEFRQLAAVHSGSRPRSRSDGLRRASSSTDLAPGDPVAAAGVQDQYCTLAEAFEQVQDVGFVVELKYPCPAARQREAMLVPDVNAYVDAVLAVVYEHAGDRPVILQAYSPLLAMACNVKQARYPVLLICDAGVDDLPPDLVDDDVDLQDVRCTSIYEAIAFCEREKLRGMTVAAKELLRAPGLIQRIKSRGLLLCTYGKDNEDTELAKWQKSQGVDFVISDNVAHLTKRLAAGGEYRLRREFGPSSFSDLTKLSPALEAAADPPEVPPLALPSPSSASVEDPDADRLSIDEG